MKWAIVCVMTPKTAHNENRPIPCYYSFGGPEHRPVLYSTREAAESECSRLMRDHTNTDYFVTEYQYE